VVIGYRSSAGIAEIALPEQWRVRVDESLLEELPGLGSVKHAAMHYAA
jgi:hypothetical protein